MIEDAGQVIYSRTNERDSVLLLWLEPWAEEHAIPGSSHVEVMMRGNAAGDPEIEEADNRITIYAPGDTFLDVSIDGRVQDSGASEIAAPNAGELGTRGFVDLVFGGFPEARPGGISAPPKTPPWRRWLSKLTR